MSRVVLDLSRLISRLRHSTPSGVDRVEMAYARGLLGLYGERLEFVAVHPGGLYGALRRDAALAYLDELERRWANEEGSKGQRSLVSVLPWLMRLLPRPFSPRGKGGVYVQVSPHHLTRQDKVRRILVREQARFLCLVHDLIPIEFPEYARPNGAALHRKRMATLAALADGIIGNSAATLEAFRPWAEGSGRQIALHVALLGTEKVAQVPPAVSPDGRPYFICVGTIEPRKNHLLLLHLWRQLAESLPAQEVPRLIVIGRRGWENEQVIDMLERCPALRDHVEELNGCPDSRIGALLRGARALLLPSFAEGYGMPVAEALAVGTPVICSDLPAMREVGGSVPDYLDPLDGPGWRAMILDHAARGAAWQAQMQRLPDWREPDWDTHMQIVAQAIAGLQHSGF